MRRLATPATLATALVLSTIGSAAATPPAPPLPLIGPAGVGQVRIGSTLKGLQSLGLVGGARKGCELSPGERVAPLKTPLKGFAVFYPKNRVSSIDLTGGAQTAAGVRIGSTVRSARQAYPGAVYDPPPPRAPIQVGFIWIGGRMHPKMTLVIDPDTHRVSEIAVPFPNICE